MSGRQVSVRLPTDGEGRNRFAASHRPLQRAGRFSWSQGNSAGSAVFGGSRACSLQASTKVQAVSGRSPGREPIRWIAPPTGLVG